VAAGGLTDVDDGIGVGIVTPPIRTDVGLATCKKSTASRSREARGESGNGFRGGLRSSGSRALLALLAVLRVHAV
jgi:hypothetical protein